MTEYEMYHTGILGMKWGVRRFQNKDGSLTSAGKKRYSVKTVLQDHKRKKNLEKARKIKADKQAKAAAEKKEAEEFESKKRKAIETGDFETLNSMKSKLSTAELREANERLNQERIFSGYAPKSTTGMDYVDQTLKKATNYMDTVTKAYDSYSKVAPRLNKLFNLNLPEVPQFKSDDDKKKEDNKKEDKKKEDSKPKKKNMNTNGNDDNNETSEPETFAITKTSKKKK